MPDTAAKENPLQGSTQRARASVAALPAALPPARSDAGEPTSDLVRTFAADATPGRHAGDVTMSPLFLRIDATHELPIVIEDDTGRPVARFARSGDAAIFAARDHQTLPAEFLLRLQEQTGGL